MPGNGHVRFGRRAAETDRQRRRHRAAARPHNLVCDPAVLVVAWARVRGNRGKRAAGVEGLRPQSIFSAEEGFLPQLRQDLKARLFTPLPVRERTIPKPGSTKLRRLGIPTARDRTVQAALKLVLEPIFERTSSHALVASVRDGAPAERGAVPRAAPRCPDFFLRC
jgi:retron-type reverse transcriptase